LEELGWQGSWVGRAGLDCKNSEPIRENKPRNCAAPVLLRERGHVLLRQAATRTYALLSDSPMCTATIRRQSRYGTRCSSPAHL